MEERGDKEADIQKRLTNDEIAFKGTNKQTDFQIRTDSLTILEVAKLVKEDYDQALHHYAKQKAFPEDRGNAFRLG